MLKQRRQRYVKGLRQFANGRWSITQSADDRAPRRIGKSRERHIKFVRILSHVVKYLRISHAGQEKLSQLTKY